MDAIDLQRPQPAAQIGNEMFLALFRRRSGVGEGNERLAAGPEITAQKVGCDKGGVREYEPNADEDEALNQIGHAPQGLDTRLTQVETRSRRRANWPTRLLPSQGKTPHKMPRFLKGKFVAHANLPDRTYSSVSVIARKSKVVLCACCNRSMPRFPS